MNLRSYVRTAVGSSQTQQFGSPGTDVRSREQERVADFTLECQVPLLRIGSAKIFLRQREGEPAISVLEEELTNQRRKIFRNTAESITSSKLIT